MDIQSDRDLSIEKAQWFMLDSLLIVNFMEWHMNVVWAWCVCRKNNTQLPWSTRRGSPTYLICRKKRKYSGCFVYMSATKAFRQRLRFRSTPDTCAWTEQPQCSTAPRFQEGVFRASACTPRTPWLSLKFFRKSCFRQRHSFWSETINPVS